VTLQDRDLPEDQSARIAAAVRDALARRHMSRQMLADQARISISTLEKVLSGRRPFTVATTVRLEEALGTALRPQPSGAQPGLAPEALGSYSETGALWIEGRYLTLRPSFGEPGAIFAYQTDIAWDAGVSHLVFREAERLDADFTHSGVVSLPPESGHVYLVTNKRGQYRLAVLGRPTIQGDMYGILTTLRAGKGSHLTPVATPIALVREGAVAAPMFGRIQVGDPCHAVYRRHLDRVTDEQFATLLSP
jgi:transcriptional regulator with XRE-family HTH domain